MYDDSADRPLNNRQELFCREMAQGASAAAAARAAGYSPANAGHQGSNLLKQPHVRHRIEVLRLGREGVRATTDMLDTVRLLRRRAMEANDHQTAIRCIEVEARLSGLYPDRPSDGAIGTGPRRDDTGSRHPQYFDQTHTILVPRS